MNGIMVNLQEDAPNYASWGQLCVAESEDMFNWKRHPFNPIFSDSGHARDSYVMKDNDNYEVTCGQTYSIL